jgi:hypothetical protein
MKKFGAVILTGLFTFINLFSKSSEYIINESEKLFLKGNFE